MEIVLKSSSHRKQNMRELAKLLTCFVSRQGSGTDLNINEHKELNDTPPMIRKKSYSTSKKRKDIFNCDQTASINPDSAEKGKSSDNDEVFYSIVDDQNQEEVQYALSQLSAKNIENFNLYE